VADILTSQTRIANRALIVLGSVERVVSIDDPSPLAGQIKDLWHESRRSGIVAHPWNFALERAQLNEATPKPVFGYERKFKIPANCLRWLPPGQGDCDWFLGEEEGGFILSDASAPLNIRYIKDVEAVELWPAHFAVFMSYQLAMDLAESATQIGASVQDMMNKREEALIEAKKLDGLASGNRSRGNVEMSSRWVSARNVPQYRVPG
jgi:hypothetical protein